MSSAHRRTSCRPSLAPAGLAAPVLDSVTATSARAAWEAPANPNGKIVNYTLVFLGREVFAGDGESRFATLSGLRPFTSYEIVLRACNSEHCVTSSAQLQTAEDGELLIHPIVL